MRALLALPLLLCGVTLFAGTARADYVSIKKASLSSAVIDDLAINSARWTGWRAVDEDRSIAIEINYTWSAATAVTMRCETTDDASTANDSGFDLHILSDSATAGTSDSVTHTWSNAVSASEKWTWTVSNLPHNYINCVFNGTSADGSDKVTVKTRGVTP